MICGMKVNIHFDNGNQPIRVSWNFSELQGKRPPSKIKLLTDADNELKRLGFNVKLGDVRWRKDIDEELYANILSIENLDKKN